MNKHYVAYDLLKKNLAKRILFQELLLIFVLQTEDGRWKKLKKESEIDGDKDIEIKCIHIYKGNAEPET